MNGSKHKAAGSKFSSRTWLELFVGPLILQEVHMCSDMSMSIAPPTHPIGSFFRGWVGTAFPVYSTEMFITQKCNIFLK